MNKLEQHGIPFFISREDIESAALTPLDYFEIPIIIPMGMAPIIITKQSGETKDE